MTAVAVLLADGRLHLQHGPIDLLCRAWGDAGAVRAAYGGAAAVFPAILPSLCAELPLLRRTLPAPAPRGTIAWAMQVACLPFVADAVTPMAAVAGAVADAVLAAMVRAAMVRAAMGGGAPLDRAFVNNGGDIAFHLAPGQSLRCGVVSDLAAPALDATVLLQAGQPSRGIATSGRACKGRGGRSFSLGIADSITVLARTAAMADAAATVIGNAVDLPGHPAVTRRPACAVDPMSDLGERLVTVDVGLLDGAAVARALAAGRARADALVRAGLIDAALLALQGRMVDTRAQESVAA